MMEYYKTTEIKPKYKVPVIAVFSKSEYYILMMKGQCANCGDDVWLDNEGSEYEQPLFWAYFQLPTEIKEM